MDEWTLNDLLECSVCLERLDTSSKVLPCQHTFCKKCLSEILDSHKELRCPECRVLVDVPIDELPPNVLLMRILEGMKNAAPKKRSGGVRGHGGVGHHVAGAHHGGAVPLQPQQVHHHHHAAASPAHALQRSGNTEHNSQHAANKQTILPGQPCARALYSYTSPEPGDLTFKKGELILLRKKVDANWFHGECSGNRGVFPSVYVEVLTPLPSPVPQCKALYDFRMTTDEEEGCLSFNKGEVITVIRRVDENWAEGKLGDRIGIFPLAFVELNQVARALMKLSTNSQPGPSRVAPPTPTSEETTPLIPIVEPQQQQPPQQGPQPTPSAASATPAAPASVAPHLLQRLGGGSVSSSSQSPSSTPNSSSTSCSSPSSTAPSSPASPPPQAGDHAPPPPHPRGAASSTSPLAVPLTPAQAPPPQPHREKRHSLNLLHAANPANLHRLSTDVSTAHAEPATVSQPEGGSQQTPPAPSSSGRHHRHRRSVSDQPAAAHGSTAAAPVASPYSQLPALYVAMYPYKPQKADELELKKGALYSVTEKCQDGWFKGTAQGSHKSGVFPGNYVALAKAQPHGAVTGTPGPRGGSSGGSRSNGHASGSPASWTRPFTAGTAGGATSAPGQQPQGVGRQAKAPAGGGERPYMDLARSMLAAAQAAMHNVALAPQASPAHTPAKQPLGGQQLMSPPELPPRAPSPGTCQATPISASWHAAASPQQQEGGLGRSQSHAGVPTAIAPPPNVTVQPPQPAARALAEKQQQQAAAACKEKKSTGLIRRLTTMKKCKSPPPSGYSMDNPVFEDGPLQPAHTRSGSCPSQLLQQQQPSSLPPEQPLPPAASRLPRALLHGQTNAGYSSQRLKHKERPNIVTSNPAALLASGGASGRVLGGEAALASSPAHAAAAAANHRKSSSLDASSSSTSSPAVAAAAQEAKKSRQLFPAVKERFRCIVPYPPNSEYELALQVGDVIHVHKKRDDGWYKGTQERTGRTGLFPASFVEAL